MNGEAVCASVRGVPIHPCFNLEQTGGESFRGSISGLGFAYCDFHQRNPRAALTRHAPARESATAMAVARPAP